MSNNRLYSGSISNFFSLAIMHGSTMLMMLLITPLIYRRITPDYYGYIQVSLSIVTLLNVAINYGFQLNAPKWVAVARGDTQRLSILYSVILSIKLSIALLLTGGIFILVFWFDVFGGYQIILLYSLILLFSETLFPFWLMQGLEKMKIIPAMTLLSKIAFFLLIFFLVDSPSDAKYVNLLQGSSALILYMGANLYIFTKLNLHWVHPSLSLLYEKLKENIYYFFSSLGGHITINSGIIILSYFAVAVQLGNYGLANRIVMLLRIVPSVVVQSVFPMLSRQYIEDKNVFRVILWKVTFVTWLSTALLGLLGYVLADQIVYLLTGSFEEPTISYLKALIFLPFLASLNIPNMILILVAEKQKLLTFSTWVSLGFMICLSILLSYKMGPLGLIIAQLLTEIVILVTQLIINFWRFRANTKFIYGLS